MKLTLGLLSLPVIITLTNLLGGCTKNNQEPYETEIYLVRHFEKQSSALEGTTDVSLTKAGQVNAERLAAHLSGSSLRAIYSTNYQRTLQSAAPTSRYFTLATTLYDPKDLTTFAKKLLSSNDSALVVGHSNTTGVLFGLLGCEEVSLGDDDYGDIMLVKLKHVGASTVLSACVDYKLAPPEIKLSELVFVPRAKLRDFWVQTNLQFSFTSDTGEIASNTGFNQITDGGMGKHAQPGKVEIGFMIDKNGKTDHFEVVMSTPSGRWDAQALQAGKQLTFVPSEAVKDLSDESRKKIYTTWIFTFK